MKNLIAATLLFSSSLLFLHAGEEKSDLERLQGTWIVASLVEKGKGLPAAEIEVLEVAIEKNVFTVTEKGKKVVEYEIKLDPSKKPATIDFTHLIGDDKGKTEPGIYVIEKGQIKMALDETRKGRPTVFEGKETEAYSVIVLKKKEAK
jgi:uncharacterized protein (TIGR03067 family)